jgi:arabinan endo-1,5-alpha-L-arabinosidase
MLWTLSLFTLGLIASVVSGYADPGACSGSCQVHDPSLVQRQSDSLYFRFSTGGGIAYASATSLAGPWTNLGYVLPQGSSINLSGNTDLWVRTRHVQYLVSLMNHSSACSFSSTSLMRALSLET